MKPSQAAYEAAKILTRSYRNPARLDAIAAELMEISWAHKKIEERWKAEKRRWGKKHRPLKRRAETLEKYQLAVVR